MTPAHHHKIDIRPSQPCASTSEVPSQHRQTCVCVMSACNTFRAEQGARWSADAAEKKTSRSSCACMMDSNCLTFSSLETRASLAHYNIPCNHELPSILLDTCELPNNQGSTRLSQATECSVSCRFVQRNAESSSVPLGAPARQMGVF